MAEMKRNDLYLDSDGTLGISADVDISKVKRILLTQEGTHYGSMYYLDDSDHIADVSKKVDADLISRREALEALKALEEKPKALEDDYDFGRRQMLETCIDIIQDLQPSPSAQPEVRTQMSSADCISRQEAVDAADRADYTGLAVEDVKKVTDKVVKELKQLPSVQPEIIHCRECRNWIKHCCYERKHMKTGFYTSGNKYCAWAERREE